MSSGTILVRYLEYSEPLRAANSLSSLLALPCAAAPFSSCACFVQVAYLAEFTRRHGGRLWMVSFMSIQNHPFVSS